MGWIFGLVFLGALYAADHFGWPVQSVLIVAIFICLVGVGNLGDVPNEISDLERKLYDLKKELKGKTSAIADFD